MECREGCAACCIEPSISSSIPGMPHGKPAGVPCIQLNEHGLCKLFGRTERPRVCGELKAEREMCGYSKEEATLFLRELEELTGPSKK